MENEINNELALFTDFQLEIAYVGLLHMNPKAISVYYFKYEECLFSETWILDMYKMIIFREGKAYTPEVAKAKFTFPGEYSYEKTIELINKCKSCAMELGLTIEEAYVMLRKLFLLKKGYIDAPTDKIKQKIVQIRNYKKYDEMTMDEISGNIENASFIGGMEETILNEGLTEFLLEGNNNLTTGVSMQFPIMTRTFKGLRKGETMSFAMPSNAGKSRFITNLISYLAFVQKKKILIISNEMTEDKMKLCLTTTAINSPEMQKLHGQNLSKVEAELLALKFRPDKKTEVEVDKDGFVAKDDNETHEEFRERLSAVSTEFKQTVIVTNWVSEQLENAIYFVNTTHHTNEELRNIILNYYYREGIEYVFYDTLKTDIEHIGDGEELKKIATVLSNIAQEFGLFVGSTLQLLENSTLPVNLSINDISGSKTVKEVLDNLCLIKEINSTTYDKYEYSLDEDFKKCNELEIPTVVNTKYYVCTVDKNRAGAKPRILLRLNLDYNFWEEIGYVRLKQNQ